MAALIRVKRRLDEDPAESLIVKCKKLKCDDITGFVGTEKFCLNLVTTVKSKDEVIGSDLQKKWGREPLQRLQTYFKSHESRHAEHRRAERKASARASRYRIVESNRSLLVDPCESGESEASEPSRAEKSQDVDSEDKGETVRDVDSKDKKKERGVGSNEEKGVVPGSDVKEEKAFDSGSDTATGSSSEVSPSASDESVTASASGGESSRVGVIRVYDVEHDAEETAGLSTSSAITVNGHEMVRRHVPPSASESPYVYDLYYLNNHRQNYDFRDLEMVLSVEAFHDEMEMMEDRADCEDEVYDDEDDSNDEGNWRNDYPDTEEDSESDEELDDSEGGSDDEQSPSHFSKLRRTLKSEARWMRGMEDSDDDEDDDEARHRFGGRFDYSARYEKNGVVDVHDVMSSALCDMEELLLSDDE